METEIKKRGSVHLDERILGHQSGILIEVKKFLRITQKCVSPMDFRVDPYGCESRTEVVLTPVSSETVC